MTDPVLLYGTETWAPTETDQDQFRVAKIKLTFVFRIRSNYFIKLG